MLIYKYFAVKDPDCYAPAMFLTKNISYINICMINKKIGKIDDGSIVPIFHQNIIL